MAHTDIDIDKFSSLKIEVLVDIISRVPFKIVARNSFLSNKWRVLWLATKNVEFDESFFVGNGEIYEGNPRRAFLDYFNRWIKNYCGKGVEKFRLAFSHPEDHREEIDNFIRFAIRGKVKMLDLDFSDPSWSLESDETHETFLQLPWYENHEMLEFLKLYSCNLPVDSRFNTFSALKNISLGWIRLDSDTIHYFLLKCPVLEVLSLKKCWYLTGNLEIVAPNLRNLIIDKFIIPSCPDKIIVDAPQLQSFKYSGTAYTDFELRNREIIEEAEFDFGLEHRYIQEGEVGDILAGMLHEISAARTLTICSFMLQAICDGEEPILLNPTLEVTHLILKTALNIKEFYGITLLLNSCPTLERLTIDLVPATRIFDFEPLFDIRDHVFVSPHSARIISYECVMNTLSTIVVNCFRGESQEIAVLKYFLGYGRALRTMCIRIHYGGAENKAYYREKVRILKQFRRSSPLRKVGLVVQFVKPVRT